MTAGQIVTAPDGRQVVLGEIGQTTLLDNDRIRGWEVALLPGEYQPWHLHHNPYLVFCLESSPCHMDWLNGDPPRHLKETVGGVVSRPTSPVHMLTNDGDTTYRNRLIELKDLGEDATGTLPAVPSPVPGEGELGAIGHEVLLDDENVRVWTRDLAPGEQLPWHAYRNPVVIVTITGSECRTELIDGTQSTHVAYTGSVAYHQPGRIQTMTNTGATHLRSRVVELKYLGERR